MSDLYDNIFGLTDSDCNINVGEEEYISLNPM